MTTLEAPVVVARSHGSHARGHARPRPRVLTRVVSATVTVALLVGVVVMIGCLGFAAEGYRISVVRSGSMTPTLHVGDLVVSRPVTPLQLRPGDLVTFKSQAVGGAAVTHRVVSVKIAGALATVVTKGDANQVTEQWNVPVATRLGLGVAHVDGVGRWLGQLGSRWVRAGAVALVGLLGVNLLGGFLWRRPDIV